MKILRAAICLLFLSTIAQAEVERKVAVALPTGGEIVVNSVFATGGEVRKIAPGASVSDNKNYAIFPVEGGQEVLEIAPPIIGLTGDFTAKHFIQLFEAQGQCNARSVFDPRYTFRIRARNTGTPKNDWIDPAVQSR